MDIKAYHSAVDLKDALAFLRQSPDRVVPYAGGTDVMIQLRENAKIPSESVAILDLQRIKAMRGIHVTDGIVSIGAMVTHSEIATSPVILEHARFLSEACSQIGSLQTRNIATIGGNVANASIAADSIPPLVALNASVNLTLEDGFEECLVKDYCMIKRAQPDHPFQKALIVSISFPSLKAYAMRFLKIGRRKAMAISRLNAAVAYKCQDKLIEDARIVVGCMSQKIERITAAEDCLIGKPVGDESFVNAGAAARAYFEPELAGRWSSAYKLPVCAELVQSTLITAEGTRDD